MVCRQPRLNQSVVTSTPTSFPPTPHKDVGPFLANVSTVPLHPSFPLPPGFVPVVVLPLHRHVLCNTSRCHPSTHMPASHVPLPASHCRTPALLSPSTPHPPTPALPCLAALILQSLDFFRKPSTCLCPRKAQEYLCTECPTPCASLSQLGWG